MPSVVGVALVGTGEDLRHRLQHMGGAGRREQDRPAQFQAGGRHEAVIGGADIRGTPICGFDAMLLMAVDGDLDSVVWMVSPWNAAAA